MTIYVQYVSTNLIKTFVDSRANRFRKILSCKVRFDARFCIRILESFDKDICGFSCESVQKNLELQSTVRRQILHTCIRII